MTVISIQINKSIIEEILIKYHNVNKIFWINKNHRIKVNNFPGGTSAMILENVDQLVKSKPDCLILHAGTNGLAKKTNLKN